MKPWDSISGDFSQDKRDPKPGEYSVVAVGGVGRVACYRPGMVLADFYRSVLADFYRSTPILVKDEKPSETKPLCGDPHKEERNVKS